MILELWKDIISEMNEKQQCEKCWKFFAPLTISKANIVRNIGECCVYVFLLRNQNTDFGERITYTNNIRTSVNRFDNYKVLFLIPSIEGLNNYNEIEGYDVAESRYETIFKPLETCITSDIITKICDNFEVTSWTGKYIYDYLDENYYGIEITINQNYGVF